MKKLRIIANWKSNKTEAEVNQWFREFLAFNFQFSTDKEIIVCPSFTLLSAVKSSVLNYQLPFKVGAQDISNFDEGSYTGEVNGRQIKEFADYVIIGHSERRKYFLETDETIFKKIKMAKKYNLTPIICISELAQIQNLNLKTLGNKLIIAYEPLFAIGSGKADNPENADKMALQIKQNLEETFVLYGGSVTSQNIKRFTQTTNIDGVLVGTASLDAKEFLAIIKNA